MGSPSNAQTDPLTEAKKKATYIHAISGSITRQKKTRAQVPETRVSPAHLFPPTPAKNRHASFFLTKPPHPNLRKNVGAASPCASAPVAPQNPLFSVGAPTRVLAFFFFAGPGRDGWRLRRRVCLAWGGGCFPFFLPAYDKPATAKAAQRNGPQTPRKGKRHKGRPAETPLQNKEKGIKKKAGKGMLLSWCLKKKRLSGQGNPCRPQKVSFSRFFFLLWSALFPNQKVLIIRNFSLKIAGIATWGRPRCSTRTAHAHTEIFCFSREIFLKKAGAVL